MHTRWEEVGRSFLVNFLLLLFIYLAVPGPHWGLWGLLSRPGIEPGPPALRAQCLSHWTSREVPVSLFLQQFVAVSPEAKPLHHVDFWAWKGLGFPMVVISSKDSNSTCCVSSSVLGTGMWWARPWPPGVSCLGGVLSLLHHCLSILPLSLTYSSSNLGVGIKSVDKYLSAWKTWGRSWLTCL